MVWRDGTILALYALVLTWATRRQLRKSLQ